MAKVRVDVLASIMRELRKKITIVPFDTYVSEESVDLMTQKYVDPSKWGVATIEGWSKSCNRTVSPKSIWDEMIYFLGDKSGGIDVSFGYFLDGIQRTTPIGKIQLKKSSFESVPIHFGQIGVALLKRECGILKREDEEVKLLIEYPNSFVMSTTNREELKDDLLENIKQATGGNIQDVDTSYRVARLKDTEKDTFQDVRELDGIKYPRLEDNILWGWCADPVQFRGQARRWTTRYRDIVEQKVYDKAIERLGTDGIVGEKYNFIVKDGPLTHVRGEFTKAALGVVKSFRIIFLDRSQMTKVFSLPYGYRSPVFTITRAHGNPEESEIYDIDSEDKRNRLVSWYVRIRAVGRHDAAWGLLRIEMHVAALPCQGHAGRWTEHDTAIVDEISHQLSREASPSSHPDPRWHNLIYPIRCCESFLRSRIVPHITARYLLGGS